MFHRIRKSEDKAAELALKELRGLTDISNLGPVGCPEVSERRPPGVDRAELQMLCQRRHELES